MIPLETRNYLIKRLKEGWDLRNACNDAKINRPTLYKYFKEDPEFKEKIQKTIDTVTRRAEKSKKMSARHELRKVKQEARNKMK